MSVRSWEAARERAAARLLDSLDDLVRRHRSLTPPEPYGALHAELITAEVAHELAVARDALRRHPRIPDPSLRGIARESR
ncbi:MAG: hypothetical protein AB7J32_00530 [Pseudonocardia sp.]